jgi:hypothetical protein
MKPIYHGKVRHVKPNACAGDVAIYTGRGSDVALWPIVIARCHPRAFGHG